MRQVGGWIRIAFAALAAGLIIMLGASPASADVDDFEFASLDVVYELSRNADGAGVVTVTERFVAVFPETDQNRGMRRSIPDSYLGGPLLPELVSVTDENGDPRPAEVETDDGYFQITSRADDFLHGRQTFVFTYTLDNVGRAMDNGVDEFYWDVNGEEWSQPFRAVTTEVRVDPDLAPALNGEGSCYVGATGSTRQCEIGTVPADGGAVAIGTRPEAVGPYETVTIAIGFEPGTFTEFDTSPFASPWGIAQIVTTIGAAGTMIWAGIVRARRLRDDEGRSTVIPEFAPPSGFDALRSALLLNRSTKAIPAEILEQAVRGAVRIIEEPKQGMFGSSTMTAQLADPALADRNGRAVLDGLFPGLRPGATFTFGKTNNRFARAAKLVLHTGKRNIEPFRRDVPGSVRSGPVLTAILSGAATVGFGIAATATYVSPALPILLIVFGVVSFFVSVLLVSRKPLNRQGAVARDHLRGLEIFMNWAEADRIRMLQSPQGAARVNVNVNDRTQMLHLYEALLPFAVIFGQEKRWAEELTVLYGDSSPGWYHGSGAFNAAAFSASMSSLTSGASSSSSTSGGSGGGGSAGGGGGGGGGGGV
ncbi:DUF2207 domain-containing protein [Microbacterium karelineae]|uniref:DUF2207 domain-containing protein n=1 Tax=Microbacterium karelineae TaxID=2654283 RepID=UPI001E2BD33B|nr:DUF2207 domain-containing protein [Microbacterium karelineae]